MHGRKFKKYSENVRLFCLTIHFYSPKAYEYLRATFLKKLPSTRTIRSWYSSIDSSPGFTEPAFDALRQKVEEAKANKKELLLGLIMDEMSIRQHSQFDRNKKMFMGHNNTGNLNSTISNGEEVCVPIATDALVIMVSGIENSFKIPIAYFLTTGMQGAENAFVLNQALQKLNEIGAKVTSITFDGAKGNLKAAKLLGVDFKMEKPYFKNPYDEEFNVYIILDVPHMLKLARNCLGNKKVLYDREGDEIKWQLFEDLVLLQLSENINLGNKLTKTHLEFENRRMNVRLAAQTLSISTATSIEYLGNVVKNEKFANCEPTAKYFSTNNNLFDIMNAKLNHCNDEYKQPFCDESLEKFISYFNVAGSYIRGLQIEEDGERKSVLQSRCFTPFMGFLNNMVSFVGIYNNYIKKNGQEKFYAFSVSQDHLESFFGCIRRMGSTNDNPTAQQFAGAYRKLLFHNEVTSSEGSNCQNDVTKILSVSSNKKSNPIEPDATELQLLGNYDFESIFLDQFTVHDESTEKSTPKLHENALAYIAGVVEVKVIQKISKKKEKSV